MSHTVVLPEAVPPETPTQFNSIKFKPRRKQSDFKYEESATKSKKNGNNSVISVSIACRKCLM